MLTKQEPDFQDNNWAYVLVNFDDKVEINCGRFSLLTFDNAPKSEISSLKLTKIIVHVCVYVCADTHRRGHKMSAACMGSGI